MNIGAHCEASDRQRFYRSLLSAGVWKVACDPRTRSIGPVPVLEESILGVKAIANNAELPLS